MYEKYLQCPHCGELQEECNCPDLFYPDIRNTKEINQQLKLQTEIQSLGYNIITCGNCGLVFIQKL